ncbi:FAD dependent oxidoreductase [Teladorsagia circumcincta]|uniref:FAD dependent oxidoreductase n=1 Tax=Teladorsagia circumcincta TaxID=45464 RepID=A0A2G9U6S1_TELCI|nr:FAD dependent oxidoreductase [Teladorsagia circumcincta]
MQTAPIQLKIREQFLRWYVHVLRRPQDHPIRTAMDFDAQEWNEQYSESVLLAAPHAIRGIAIIGEGVIGLSTALAIKQQDPAAQITIFHDRPFDRTLSKGIAGLFRIDKPTPLQRIYGNDTFTHLAELWRTLGGFSGVQLLSGHILSENLEMLHDQPPNLIPFQLADEGYSVVVNCAGMNGARLAGDDEDLYPIRGILLKVDAPWQKHFLMRNTNTFTIPTIGAVYVGTVKEDRKDSMKITKEEINNLWNRYLQLQPSFKGVKILDHFVGLRPGRAMVRVESETRTTPKGITYKVSCFSSGNLVENIFETSAILS